jgi:hypothetical protein
MIDGIGANAPTPPITEAFICSFSLPRNSGQGDRSGAMSPAVDLKTPISKHRRQNKADSGPESALGQLTWECAPPSQRLLMTDEGQQPLLAIKPTDLLQRGPENIETGPAGSTNDGEQYERDAKINVHSL